MELITGSFVLVLVSFFGHIGFVIVRRFTQAIENG
jgi:hypothetical protein